MLDMIHPPITRINHFPEIAKKRKWDRKESIRQIIHFTGLSWPSAAKWADGDPNVDLDTLERIQVWLGVSKDDLIESN